MIDMTDSDINKDLLEIIKALTDKIERLEKAYKYDNLLMKSGFVVVNTPTPHISNSAPMSPAGDIAKMEWSDIHELVKKAGGHDMPEKMTKEEAIIAMAIKKARKAKICSRIYSIMPYDHEVEVVKIKRPSTKCKLRTNPKERRNGLAGETLKKADKMVPVSRDLEEKLR